MSQSSDYQEFKQLCQSHGCRCTPQRYAVYSYMRQNLQHPDVNRILAMVRKRIPTITRESVFRILCELAEFGVINRMDQITAARFDGRVADHGHLICERCGCVADFDLPQKPFLPQDRQGFTTRYTEVRSIGLCAECTAAAGPGAQSGGDDSCPAPKRG